jgi:S1-C subfamily serine protease
LISETQERNNEMSKVLVATLLIAGAVFLSGCATPVQQAQVKQTRDIPTGVDAKPIQFKRVVVKLRRGEPVGELLAGLACIKQPFSGDLTWRGGRLQINDEEFTESFREELQKANYPVVGDPNALFEDPSAWKAEVLVAGLITKVQMNACFPYGGFGNWRDSKGDAFVKVNWQVFGSLERKVVYEVTTEGSFSAKEAAPQGADRAIIGAFAAATQNLLADKGFHDLISRKGQQGSTNPSQQLQSKIWIKKVESAGTITQARDASITVFAGTGHGSGFIISNDGYAITNEHVVKEARFIKARLANGREVLADVIRTDSARDVALLKLRETNLPAASIHQGVPPDVGEDVFAIGTPRQASLDVTVSKGIISSYRDIRNMKYIQSDVQIHPGNSGGPLVRRDGSVVGVAVQGLQIGGASQNLNFFIPISEALLAMNVSQ